MSRCSQSNIPELVSKGDLPAIVNERDGIPIFQRNGFCTGPLEVLSLPLEIGELNWGDRKETDIREVESEPLSRERDLETAAEAVK